MLLLRTGQHIYVRVHLHRKSFPNFMISADMAFHHHDTQAFCRLHNIKTLPTQPHTTWPNRAAMSVRLFKKFLSALVDTAPKNLDQTTLAQIPPAQLMREGATVRNTQVTLSGKTPVELAMGRRPIDLTDPAFMNPEQANLHINQTRSLERGNSKADYANLEIQQRGNFRRDLAERMRFVPPDLRVGEKVLFLARRPQ